MTRCEISRIKTGCSAGSAAIIHARPYNKAAIEGSRTLIAGLVCDSNYLIRAQVETPHIERTVDRTTVGLDRPFRPYKVMVRTHRPVLPTTYRRGNNGLGQGRL